jgi:glycosyltransferase involved in cell wall biosynthesis
MRVAVVTPYYKEPLDVLERCHESVKRQTHPCAHFMVADGHPQQEVSEWQGVNHFVLPFSHGDFGNTPRACGGMSAFNQGFDAVAYLDADNWYREEHVESLVAAATQHQASVAFSYRQIVLSTGEPCPFVDQGELDGSRIDTSCYFFTKEAAFLAPVWAMMDPRFAPMCDLFMRRVVGQRVPRVVGTGRHTVVYVSHWRLHFEQMGKEPPADAKDNLDLQEDPAPYDPALNMARLGFDPLAG